MKNKVPEFSHLANYNCRFIVNYNTEVCPLINLTKDIYLTCGHTQQQGFGELWARFLSAPILTQINRKVNIIMEPNSNNQAIGGILSKYHYINVSKYLHLQAYYAKTRSATKCNWPIHEKELLTFVDSVWQCRDSPVGAKLNLYTDYPGLQCWNIKQELNFAHAL